MAVKKGLRKSTEGPEGWSFGTAKFPERPARYFCGVAGLAGAGVRGAVDFGVAVAAAFAG
jgi:hypothetical protein